MFSFKPLKISDYSHLAQFELIRDCSFKFLGKVPTALPEKLVPCSKNTHLIEAIARSDVVGIITTQELAAKVPLELGLAVTVSPREAFYAIHMAIASAQDFWCSFPTEIAPTATIETGAIIAPQNVRIGDRTHVAHGAVIHERTLVGSDCYIGNNSIIGGKGFEVDAGRILPQIGGVLIGHNVEILSNSNIARATFGGFTEVGEGTKIDNLVHIGHDCKIGRDVLIVCGAKFGGRTIVEDGVFVGINAVTAPGLTIGAKSRLSMGAVVVKDVPEGRVVAGNFAVDHMKWLRFVSPTLR